MKTKNDALKKYPDAYCVRLNDGTGYIVWPERGTAPRGFERPAIGFGKTARKAWASVR